MPQRVCIYCRVSTEDQLSNFSPASQLAGCQKYAQVHGFEVIGEFTDNASGTLLDRPQLNALLALVASTGCEAVVCYSPDRWSRKLSHMLLLRELLAKTKTTLHFVTSGEVVDDPYGRFTANLLSSMAELDRELLLERTKRGKLQKARDGKWPGVSVPYGYRRVPGTKGRNAALEIDPVTSEIVKRIFSMYLGLDGGVPLGRMAIAKRLQAEGIPHPQHGPKSAPGWQEQTVGVILTNEVCIGVFRWRDETIMLPELALIDVETFEAAQVRKDRNRSLAKRNRQYEYLLAGGYIKCTCGRTLVGHRVQNNFYYICTNRRNDTCKERYVRASTADQQVWDWVHGLLSDDANLMAGIARMQEQREVDLGGKRERLAVLRDLIAGIDKRLERLTRAYSEAAENAVANALMTEMKTLGSQRTDLDGERAIVENQLKAGVIDVDAIQGVAATLRERLDGADYNTRRWLLDRLNLVARLEHHDGLRMLNMTCAVALEGAFLVIDANRC